MKVTIKFICWWCLITGSAFSCFAKEWRGILPLHSTRAEVIKTLGSPQRLLWDYQEYFEVGNEIVKFQWIDPSCLRRYPVEPAKTLQADDLVLSISIRLKQPTSITELHRPEGEIYFSSCLGRFDEGCIFIYDGFSYATSKEGVTSFSIWPTAKDFKEWEESHGSCVSSHR